MEERFRTNFGRSVLVEFILESNKMNIFVHKTPRLPFTNRPITSNVKSSTVLEKWVWKTFGKSLKLFRNP